MDASASIALQPFPPSSAYSNYTLPAHKSQPSTPSSLEFLYKDCSSFPGQPSTAGSPEARIFPLLPARWQGAGEKEGGKGGLHWRALYTLHESLARIPVRRVSRRARLAARRPALFTPLFPTPPMTFLVPPSEHRAEHRSRARIIATCLAILVVNKHVLSAIAAAHHMIPETNSFTTQCSCHASIILLPSAFVRI